MIIIYILFYTILNLNASDNSYQLDYFCEIFFIPYEIGASNFAYYDAVDRPLVHKS